MPTYKKINRALHLVLYGKKCGDEFYANDVDKAMSIFCDVAQLLTTDLDNEQKHSIQVAKRLHLGSASEEERLNSLEILWSKDKRIIEETSPKSKEFCINRLVLGSLINNTGLSLELGEYLVWWAEIAGVSADELDAILRLHIPEYT